MRRALILLALLPCLPAQAQNRSLAEHYAGALKQLEARQWKPAARTLHRIATLKPKHDGGKVWYHLGRAFRGLGQHEQAVAAFAAGREHGDWSRFQLYYLRYGNSLMRTGQFKEALRIYTDGARQFPDSPWLDDHQGWARRFLGQTRRADKLLRRGYQRYWSKATYRQRLRLTLPIKGRWACIAGNGEGPTHIGLMGRHAWDFEVRKEGRSLPEGKGDACRDYYTFGQPVHAPAPGKVTRVRDDVPDNRPHHRNPAQSAGNVVMIEHAGGVYSLYCHLRKGSVRVAVDQQVARGQLLGQAGNSGYSALPHLHLVVLRREKEGWVSLPAKFSGYRLVWPRQEAVASGSPKAGEYVER